MPAWRPDGRDRDGARKLEKYRRIPSGTVSSFGDKGLGRAAFCRDDGILSPGPGFETKMRRVAPVLSNRGGMSPMPRRMEMRCSRKGAAHSPRDSWDSVRMAALPVVGPGGRHHARRRSRVRRTVKSPENSEQRRGNGLESSHRSFTGRVCGVRGGSHACETTCGTRLQTPLA